MRPRGSGRGCPRRPQFQPTRPEGGSSGYSPRQPPEASRGRVGSAPRGGGATTGAGVGAGAPAQGLGGRGHPRCLLPGAPGPAWRAGGGGWLGGGDSRAETRRAPRGR